jgi:hypothetical protein
MALNNEPAGSGRQKKTFLVFNRITGDVVSIHHVSHAAGVDLPDNRALEAHVLSTISAARLSQELGVIAYEGKVVDADAARRCPRASRYFAGFRASAKVIMAQNSDYSPG